MLALVVHCTIGVLLYRDLCALIVLVCEERVYKLCMCLFVCVLSLYMFVCASECTTVHIGKRHAARYGRL